MLKKIGNVSTESVKKHTKKNWDQWIKVLNKKYCQQFSHQELVKILKNEFDLRPWWQQEVSRGYQIAIGVRIPQQTLKGTYTTTATKTIQASTAKVFSFFLSEEGQKTWLNALYKINIDTKEVFECHGGIFGEVRGVSKNKKIRLSWINESWTKKSNVQLLFLPKGKKQCMVVINHIDLPSLKAKTEMHGRWRMVLDQIREMNFK